MKIDFIQCSTFLFPVVLLRVQDVEEGGDRWSKPHVSTISLHSLMDLRSFLLNGTVLLDMEATSLENIAELILENMVNPTLSYTLTLWLHHAFPKDADK